MSSGKKQHFVPAALIGQFTFENKHTVTKLRDRKVYVKFRKSSSIKELKPSDFLKEKNIYSIQHESNGLNKNSIDNIWNIVEPILPTMIKRLNSSYAKSTLSPALFIYFSEFFTQLLVRNPSFTKNFNDRVKSILDYDSLEKEGSFSAKDNTNAARIFEIQRLRPLFLYADISLFKPSKNTYFINNDIGYVIGYDDNSILQRVTITFPVTSDLAMQFHINREDDKYDIDLLQSHKKFVHHRLYASSVKKFNQSMYLSSNTLVYGNRKELLTDDLPTDKKSQNTYGFWYALDQQKLLTLGREHELDYHLLNYRALISHYLSTPE